MPRAREMFWLEGVGRWLLLGHVSHLLELAGHHHHHPCDG
jgi:hypothetical protein